MSQEHDHTKPDDATHVDGGIRTESAPFEPGYQPETLPHISVPDLADDAQGLSAEALAQVPTLTEWVDASAQGAPLEAVVAAPSVEVVSEPTESVPVIQEAPAQSDTWVEDLQVRMGKLTGDIHTLNARLDRLEERNKTKV
jgi:hypothetical protein